MLVEAEQPSQIITKELGGTTFEAFWANLAFTLTVVISLPIYASASDVLGRMIPLYTCYVLFLVGSVVFATANSMVVVIIGRLLQGLGGGGLDVLNEILIVDITTLKERPLYLGLMAVPMALGTIAGPIIGAGFSENASWRWLGWINVPLIGVDIVLAALFLRLKSLEEPLSTRFARLDWIGSLMFTVGAAAFVLPLSWAGNLYPWSSWKTIVPLVIGMLVLLVFAFYEAKPEAPLFPHRIFKSRTSLMTLLSGTVHGLIIYPATTYLPLFFQAVKLQSPLQSAVSILPSCCGVVGFALLSGVAVDVSRRYLWQFWASWVSVAVGIGIISTLDRSSSVAKTAGLQIVAGVGLGALWTVPALSMQASAANVEDQALAVGILVAFRLFGALIGLATASTVFASVFEKAIAALQPLPAAAATLGRASQAIGFIPGLSGLDIPSNVLGRIIEVYRESFQVLWYVMAGFAFVGFFSSMFIEEKSIEAEEMSKQHLQTRDNSRN
ncbi:putative efflux pump antibiotic resistance [Diaporthe ampelina]|uniref:Putative efflux pump antibiotic resistance n=1 Tax=Diaporthe ampelina TaxID=1214573 RepID=A0A0G2FR77_9PEZI|nr:putative efflux pump antibiotic resistance [Diaporthe ampelina]